jgi:hypothetical protein
MYIGYTRLATKLAAGGFDCREVLQRALDVEDQTGCDPNVWVYGWKLAYIHWLNHDKAKATMYYDKCYLFDSATYGADRHWFYPQ